MNIQTISFVALLLIAVSGCAQKNESTHSYNPLNNVSFVINTKKLDYHSDTKSVFLYFDLKVENKASEDVFINVGKIQANLNGEPSKRTYYDSLASVIPKEEKLKNGISTWKLYFVFPEHLKARKIEQFRVTDYGLRTT